MKKILEKLMWEELKEEGITKEDLEMVDLDIEYSPVIPMRGGEPMEAIKLEDNKYRVPDCEFLGLNLSVEQIKIMRYRYLINRR
jgi:hypothetical protein